MRIQRGRETLLKKGLAVTLALLLMCISLSMGGIGSEAFAQDEESAGTSAEIEEQETDLDEDEADDETKDDVSEEVPMVSDTDLVGEDSEAEEAIEQIENNGDLLLFGSSGNTTRVAKSKKVKLGYNKLIKYENNQTNMFKVTVDGKKQIAYCIQPGKSRLTKGDYTAVSYNTALMRKALYYSYGYPGYEKKTKAYLKGVSRKACYKGDNGAYALFHVLLSYVYKSEGGESNAFKGVSAESKTMIKNVLKEIKKWDCPPETDNLEFSSGSLKAEWNEEEEVQKTGSTKLNGSAGNSVSYTVPKDVTMIKKSSAGAESVIKAGQSTTISVGDSISFTAPKTVSGSYKSPEMAGSVQAFDPFYIQGGKKQDTLFGIPSKTSASFSVEWIKTGTINLVKESEDEALTGKNEYYSLEGAKYSVFRKSDDKEIAVMETDSDGKASCGDLLYGEYYVKELSAPRGFTVDENSHDVNIEGAAADLNVKEAPEKPLIHTDASEAKTKNNVIEPGGMVTIEDVVYYENLEAGVEYTIRGNLIDKTTGDAIEGSDGEITFTPENTEGHVVVKLVFNSDSMVGGTVVAFENLYYKDSLIASHEDINSEKQAISVVKKDAPVKPERKVTSPGGPSGEGSLDNSYVNPEGPSGTMPKTGDEMPFGLLCSIMCIAVIFGVFRGFRRI